MQGTTKSPVKNHYASLKGYSVKHLKRGKRERLSYKIWHYEEKQLPRRWLLCDSTAVRVRRLKATSLRSIFQLLKGNTGAKKARKEKQQLTETSTGVSSYSLAIAFLKVSFL